MVWARFTDLYTDFAFVTELPAATDIGVSPSVSLPDIASDLSGIRPATLLSANFPFFGSILLLLAARSGSLSASRITSDCAIFSFLGFRSESVLAVMTFSILVQLKKHIPLCKSGRLETYPDAWT